MQTTRETSTFQVNHLCISFGGLKAVSDFNLELPPMSLRGLIGPNGAGKTTVFNLITGVYRPDSGEMRLGDRSLLGMAPYQITAAGVARTFQNIRLFGHLSVLENVLVSRHMTVGYGYADTFLRSARYFRCEREMTERGLALLELMGLAKRAGETARFLSYGDQRRLEIARALATDPQVLLLDEPAAGLNTQEKAQLMETVSEIRRRFRVTVLLIEHDMKLVMGICERVTVLDHGEVIAEGTPKEIQENPKVIEAYLGGA